MHLPAYTTAMKLCGKLAWLDEVEQLWRELVETNYVDSRAAGARIDAAADNGDIQGATRVLDYMEEQGLEQTVAHFSSAINACANAHAADRGKEAQAFFDTMVTKGLKPDIAAYSNLLRALQDEPSQRFLDLLEDMKRQDVKVDSVFAEIFMFIFLRIGRNKRAKEVRISHLKKLDVAHLETAKELIEKWRTDKVEMSQFCSTIDGELGSILTDEAMWTELLYLVLQGLL